MILLDVGNTFTKWEVVGPTTLTGGGWLTHHMTPSLSGLLVQYPGETRILASWVGNHALRAEVLEELANRGVDIKIITSEAQRFGLSNGYKEPQKLGVDRWLAMLGLWLQRQRAFCVVDAGTAMTIDFVDRKGFHAGGYIVPGVRTMINSLNCSTAQIDCPEKSLVSPDILPGCNTGDAVQNGVLLSLVGAIQSSINIMRKQWSVDKFDCVIGGGDADVLASLLDDSWQIDRALVLSGLRAYL